MSRLSPQVRIVVPCRNAGRTIAGCLDALARSTDLDAEIVVVDDGQNPPGAFPSPGDRLAIVRTAGGEGAGAARNAGARGFGGTVLVFVDADVEVTRPDTLATLVGPVLRKEADATVGTYAPSVGGGIFARYKQYYLSYKYGNDREAIANTFWSALCAVDTGWFASLGGFPECYRGAGPEDIEFGIALTASRGRILPVPGAQGYHLTRFTLWSLIRNDMRKGTEDIFVHWLRRIPLTDNRHVKGNDVAAVAAACSLPLALCVWSLAGPYPVASCGLAYLFLRWKFLKDAFRGAGAALRVVAVPLTFILDIVRAAAVIAGSTLAAGARLTGRPVPYVHRSRRRSHAVAPQLHGLS